MPREDLEKRQLPELFSLNGFKFHFLTINWHIVPTVGGQNRKSVKPCLHQCQWLRGSVDGTTVTRIFWGGMREYTHPLNLGDSAKIQPDHSECCWTKKRVERSTAVACSRSEQPKRMISHGFLFGAKNHPSIVKLKQVALSVSVFHAKSCDHVGTQRLQQLAWKLEQALVDRCFFEIHLPWAGEGS